MPPDTRRSRGDDSPASLIQSLGGHRIADQDTPLSQQLIERQSYSDRPSIVVRGRRHLVDPDVDPYGSICGSVSMARGRVVWPPAWTGALWLCHSCCRIEQQRTLAARVTER